MHTPLCHHAVGEPVEYACRAVELGLTEIGFSDHSPMPRADFDDWRMRADQLDEYVAKVQRAVDEEGGAAHAREAAKQAHVVILRQRRAEERRRARVEQQREQHKCECNGENAERGRERRGAGRARRARRGGEGRVRVVERREAVRGGERSHFLGVCAA